MKMVPSEFHADLFALPPSSREPRTPDDRFGAEEAPRPEGVLPAMTKLDQLYAEKTKNFDEICALVARELGYGELATINPEHRNRVEREAEQYLKEWEESVELRTRFDIRPITPLRRLLSDHLNICERILDEQDIEAGLWAYKRGTRRRRRRASL